VRRSIAVHLARGILRLSGWRAPWIELPAGAVIVAPNHRSLFDGPLMACVTDRPMLFAVDPDWCCREPWRFALNLLSRSGFGEVVPLDSRRPFAWRRLAAKLLEGAPVCLFPEGAIARGEEPLPIRPGLARLARIATAPILPVRIERSARVWAAPLGASHLESEQGLADALKATWSPRHPVSQKVAVNAT
jgi:1-acyl-sn-glycerol-3-phosphate acyltransferase